MRPITLLAAVLPIAHAVDGNSSYQDHEPSPAGILQNSVRGVKKMTDDEGEKFFFSYWDYEHDEWAMQSNITHAQHDEHNMKARSYPLRSSTLAIDSDLFSLRFRRDFKCPTGTFSCTSIDRPESCCSTGDTCELVEDTGSGDVGCCPQGEECSGTIGSCQSDYTACPSSLGGGCCIPGYDCVSGGCARVSTITITFSSTVLISTTTYTTPMESTTSLSTGTSTSSSTTSTGDLVPPARPTGVSTSTTSETASVCPTGFYACSAYYEGGCCRTGRNCDTTSCPATSSTTMVSDGVTIVAPAATTTTTGHCASGWSSCAASAGGGCCPTGYVCGSSCTAMESGSATATVVKTQPESKAVGPSWEVVRGMMGISILGMLWLC